MTNSSNDRLFISHSTQDDDFVRRLREALMPHGQEAWVDSRELRGGDLLWEEIQKAIAGSTFYAVVVSTDALQSKWVGRELRHALEIQQDRGRDNYPVFTLSLNDTRLGVLEDYFGEEPVYIPVSGEAGGIEKALDAILVALRKRLGTDVVEKPQPKAEPLEDLVLELSNLKLTEEDGKQRASGDAQLIYEPATEGLRHVESEQKWRFTAPIGPIEANELKWYLEQYAVWPSEYFAPRARKVEENLEAWGRMLYQAAMPVAHVANVLMAWAKVNTGSNRRFSIFIRNSSVAGTAEEEVQEARECATLLLGLPWELLHDGSAYLFQGAHPVRVRRRLPNTQSVDVPVMLPPVRILLITARPEDKACDYIDHRASAEPLVSAMEALGGLVELTVLSPPTLPALREALRRQQYHVVHFDGHGVYNRSIGLGGLCFEHPEDAGSSETPGKLKNRRHQTIYTQELGELLHQHRIPLVFLEACQTAMSEDASESVASELLQQGVASVVAMSHSVLVETARRFVKVFYRSLTEGERVGAAMLAGQHALKDDSFRGNIFGAGELHLADWFVPVLFQEKADPQLFDKILPSQAQADVRTALQRQLEHLPEAPPSGFIGRSRDLLALERLLQVHRYAVVLGQGGEGKTALAAEFGRWQLRSRQQRRVAFVSVEQHQHAGAVLDTLGKQLVNKHYSVAKFDAPEQALLPVEQALKEQSTLLVVDNMESILLPPFLRDATPEVLSEEAFAELEAILALCAQLNQTGNTRIVFTSRETLPAPFDNPRQLIGLHSLNHTDAVKLVERTLNTEGGEDKTKETDRADIEDLVNAVNGHARTLTLLAPSLQHLGVKATTHKLVELMAAMKGNREQSVFASVALSLERLSTENRQRVRVLGLFHGEVALGVLRAMMAWEEDDVNSLARELLATGLATLNPYNHLSLNAALCPYLREQMDETEHDTLNPRWLEAMRAYVNFLVRQDSSDAQVAATLTLLELPNLFALLEQVAQADDAEATIGLCTSLYGLLQYLGKPRLLARIAQLRDAAETTLGDTWNHARFQAQRIRIEQQLQQGQLQEAYNGAQRLLEQVRSAGEAAYDNADYDVAMAHFLLARVMESGGAAEQALGLLAEAFSRFEAIATDRESKSAAGMASACLTETGDCLLAMGRYDEAAGVYQENIQRAEKLGKQRSVVVNKLQLGTVHMMQKKYTDALETFTQARAGFEHLGEPGSVAVAWHQTAMVYGRMGQPEAAENAYRQSLAIEVQQGNVAGQASTLAQLSNLYADQLGRTEEAVALLRQATDKYVEIGDVASEGLLLSNLAVRLRELNRPGEARQAIQRAIDCKSKIGHAAEPWKTWNILCNIETDEGNTTAAAQARQKAFECYLAYRRDGGENHQGTGRLANDITQMLLEGDTSKAETLLQEVSDQFNEAGLGVFHSALQAITGGSRDNSLADHPELDYNDAAEIVILLETLEAAG